jgi:hypothetical protein
LKKIVRRAVFLKDHDNVLDGSVAVLSLGCGSEKPGGEKR